MIDLRYGRDVLEALREIPDATVQCCVTSPPYYGLRDYKVAGQIGLEPTLDEFLARLVAVFREVRRVLHPTGVLWVNMGDSYNGDKVGSTQKNVGGARANTNTFAKKLQAACPPKALLNVPYRLAFALADDGWLHRDTVIWHKPAPMPESVRDRCTKAWEPIFMFVKQPRYFADMEGVKQPAVCEGETRVTTAKSFAASATANGKTPTGNAVPGRVMTINGANLRNVWRMASEPYKGAHFATFPSELPRRCLKIGTSPRGCCPTCRAPWVRLTERKALKRVRPGNLAKCTGEDKSMAYCPNDAAGVAVTTTGWQQSCRCPVLTPIPCTVLDPFCGSGTTMRVAAELGLDGIGIDLNHDYLPLARERVGALYLKREESA